MAERVSTSYFSPSSRHVPVWCAEWWHRVERPSGCRSQWATGSPRWPVPGSARPAGSGPPICPEGRSWQEAWQGAAHTASTIRTWGVDKQKCMRVNVTDPTNQTQITDQLKWIISSVTNLGSTHAHTHSNTTTSSVISVNISQVSPTPKLFQWTKHIYDLNPYSNIICSNSPTNTHTNVGWLVY